MNFTFHSIKNIFYGFMNLRYSLKSTFITIETVPLALHIAREEATELCFKPGSELTLTQPLSHSHSGIRKRTGGEK